MGEAVIGLLGMPSVSVYTGGLLVACTAWCWLKQDEARQNFVTEQASKEGGKPKCRGGRCVTECPGKWPTLMGLI